MAARSIFAVQLLSQGYSFAVCSANFSGSYITYITHLLSDLQDAKPGLGLALCVRFCWLVLFGSIP